MAVVHVADPASDWRTVGARLGAILTTSVGTMDEAGAMRTVAPILAGAALIAAAIVYTFRWEIVTADHGGVAIAVYRLDRWSGKVVRCNLTASRDVDCDD